MWKWLRWCFWSVCLSINVCIANILYFSVWGYSPGNQCYGWNFATGITTEVQNSLPYGIQHKPSLYLPMSTFFLMLRCKIPAYKWEKLVISWHGDSSSDEEERGNLHELHADTCRDASAQKEFKPASLSSSLQLVSTDLIALLFWLSCLSSVHLVKSLDKTGDVWRQRGLQGFLYCRLTAEDYH